MIDPWASTSVDYDKLVNQFGIQKISDMILAEAVDNNYGMAADDITVIVIFF